MSIPKAVSPSVKVPGVYMTVDLKAGTASPGTGTLRVALLCPKATTGDLTVDTEVRLGAGKASAKTAFGIGAHGALAAKQIYDKEPTATVDFIAPTAGVGTATLDITAANSPSSDAVVDVDISGREFEVAWPAGGTAADFATDLIAAITSRSEILPVTAASGGAAIASINSKTTGNIGNDTKIYMKIREQTSTETLNGGTVVNSSLTGGTTDPDFATALANIAGREYHYILLCLSNADAINVSTSNNIDATYTHISGLNTGLGAKLQQFVVGCTGTVAQAIASTPSANSCNNADFGEFILCIGARDLPCEVGAREVGGRLAAISKDPSANRIGEIMDGLAGSRDKIADEPTDAEAQSCFDNGVSLITYTAQGSPVLMRAITTHSQDTSGGQDDRLLDTQNVDATYIVSRDIRDNLPIAFPQAKITEDIEEGDDPPPKGVLEERDVKAWDISRLRYWQDEGVVTKSSIDTAVADGTLIVEVDSSDATQVNHVIPFKIVQPLAKHGVVAQRLPS